MRPSSKELCRLVIFLSSHFGFLALICVGFLGSFLSALRAPEGSAESVLRVQTRERSLHFEGMQNVHASSASSPTSHTFEDVTAGWVGVRVSR